jgi:hypothetical protein
VGSLTSHNPIGLQGLLWDSFTLLYSKAHTGKYLVDNFPTQNGVKQGGALSPLLFNFDLEYDIRSVQENQMGPKLNGAHQLLAYADDLILLGDNINTIKKKTETLIYAIKEVGIEINVEKTNTCCHLVTRMQVKIRT